MKIVDCFTFYNELDMLEYRLNVLKNCVDYFILVEARYTHIGKPKPLFFQDNQERYAEFKDKIIHVIVDNFPHIYPNINTELGEQWENEKFQRNCIKNGLDKLELNDKDVIIISDLDEIPDPDSLFDIINNDVEVQCNSLRMTFYYYNLNSLMQDFWYHAKLLSYKMFKEFNAPCDAIRLAQFPMIEKGGWHLSYFGDSAFIKNKLENFAHQEFNKQEFTDIDRIESRVNRFTDLFDRNGSKIVKVSVRENKYLPPKYKRYLSKFVKF